MLTMDQVSQALGELRVTLFDGLRDFRDAVDNKLERMERGWNAKLEDVRNGLGAMIESMDDRVKLIAEGHGVLNEKLDVLQGDVSVLKSDVSVLKSDVSVLSGKV